MQAVLEKTESRVKKSKRNINVLEFVTMLETADVKRRNELENQLVALGNTILPELVDCLQSIKGAVRGVLAMIIIRIGKDAINYLEEAARKNADFAWISNYLVYEISGSSRRVA